MSCTREDLKARITDVLVGEAEPSMRDAVFAHAETCPSCAEDRARMTSVLGLLRETPPWKSLVSAEAGGDADALSTIQRQELVAAARPRPGGKPLFGRGPMSWLAFAAGLSAVGVALVLARRASVTPLEVEAPTPAAVTSSVHTAPVAPEGPMLPRVISTPVPPPVAPAALRERVPMNVEVSKEAMQEFQKPVEAIEAAAPARDLAKARREVAPAAAPATADGMNLTTAGAAGLPVILQLEGAHDPLHQGASVLRVLVARANAAAVVCVEFDPAFVSRPSRLGGAASRTAAHGGSPCAGERFDVPPGPSTGVLFEVTARSGPSTGLIGRVTVRESGAGARELASRPIERAETDAAFATMSADFRIAYIEARLSEPATAERPDASHSLLPLAAELPDTPRARELMTRLRSSRPRF